MILRQVAPDEAAGAAALALQTAVLRPDGPLPGDSEHAIGALTVAAIDGEVVVGAVTVDRARWPVPDLAVLPDPQWQLRSLAVAPAARGSGLGGQLVAAAVDLARDAGRQGAFGRAEEAASCGGGVCAGWRGVSRTRLRGGRDAPVAGRLAGRGLAVLEAPRGG